MDDNSKAGYWAGFREYAKKDPRYSGYVSQQAAPQSYYDVSFGTSLAHANAAIAESPKNGNSNIQVKIYFTGTRNISGFDVAEEFNKYRDIIESNVGQYNFHKKVSKHPTFVFSTKGDINDRSSWDTYYEWQISKIDAIVKTVKELDNKYKILSYLFIN